MITLLLLNFVQCSLVARLNALICFVVVSYHLIKKTHIQYVMFCLYVISSVRPSVILSVILSVRPSFCPSFCPFVRHSVCHYVVRFINPPVMKLVAPHASQNNGFTLRCRGHVCTCIQHPPPAVRLAPKHRYMRTMMNQREQHQ